MFRVFFVVVVVVVVVVVLLLLLLLLLLCIIITIYNFCIALFSGVPKLTALYNILQHFLSFTNIIHIIMTTNNI